MIVLEGVHAIADNFNERKKGQVPRKDTNIVQWEFGVPVKCKDEEVEKNVVFIIYVGPPCNFGEYCSN